MVEPHGGEVLAYAGQRGQGGSVAREAHLADLEPVGAGIHHADGVRAERHRHADCRIGLGRRIVLLVGRIIPIDRPVVHRDVHVSAGVRDLRDAQRERARLLVVDVQHERLRRHRTMGVALQEGRERGECGRGAVGPDDKVALRLLAPAAARREPQIGPRVRLDRQSQTHEVSVVADAGCRYESDERTEVMVEMLLLDVDPVPVLRPSGAGLHGAGPDSRVQLHAVRIDQVLRSELAQEDGLVDPLAVLHVLGRDAADHVGWIGVLLNVVDGLPHVAFQRRSWRGAGRNEVTIPVVLAQEEDHLAVPHRDVGPVPVVGRVRALDLVEKLEGHDGRRVSPPREHVV